MPVVTSQNGRRAAVRTMCTTKAKERCCDCFRGGARQHGAPTHAPRLLRTLLQDRCLVPRSGSGQLRHKRPGLSRPTATHFHGEHHQPRDRGPTNSGYVRSFYLLAACNTTPSASAAEPCVTITVEGAHECRVHCQLTSPKQGKAVHPDLQRLSNGLGATRSRSRTNTLVVTRPPASRHMRAAALSKANPLRPKTPNRGRRWWPNESIGRPRRGQSNQRAGARPGLRAHLGPVTWRCSLKCLSTCDDASCCQPRLTLPARCPLVPQVQDELLPPMHAMKEVQIPWFL